MSKLIKNSTETKDILLNCANTLNESVKCTLGPKGRNNIVKFGYDMPLITNDGVTIVKNIKSEDEFENIGMDIIKEVAIKTNEVVGDGTTTATILATEMIKTGLNFVKNNSNPIMLKKGMEKARKIVIEKIDKESTVINGKEDIKKVASISASDNSLGDIVADAIEFAGKDGIVNVEESNEIETKVEVVDGMKIDKGYISSYMVTDNEKMEVILEDCYILVTDKKINSIQEIIDLLEELSKENKKILIIAEDIEKEVLSTLIINKLRGTFYSACIKAPSFGDRKKETLKDIACFTNAKYVSEELGEKIDSITINDLGKAKKIRITKDYTVIIGGDGTKSEVEGRIESIKNRLNVEHEEYEKEKLKERIAKLSAKIAIIRVGGITETEMKEKKMRIDDALSGAMAAMKDGIVEGGGVTYLKASSELEDLLSKLNGDERLGVSIVKKALEKPIKQILENAGKEANVIINDIKNNKLGYDVINEKYVNMKENGIIDPTLVAKEAINNAVSIASLVITTENMCIDELEKEKNKEIM